MPPCVLAQRLAELRIARTVICEVDEVLPLGAFNPYEVVTPGIYVDYLVQCKAVRLLGRGF
jgi:acyl CoA:acetate/3-ketoacid CoA transferase alpha subunit